MASHFPGTHSAAKNRAISKPSSAKNDRRGPRPRPDGLPARRAALDILMLVRRGMPLDKAIATCRSFAALEGSDRAFARLLVSTTLRFRGSLDEVIGQFLNTPLPHRAREAQDILRLAAAQLLYLETPAHAAVSTAAALCDDKKELSGYKGLINAIARKIGEQGPDILKKHPARINTPGWMWRNWERAFGPAVTKQIALINQTLAPLDLTVKDPDSRKALARKIREALTKISPVTPTPTAASPDAPSEASPDSPPPDLPPSDDNQCIVSSPVTVTPMGPATLRLRGYTGAIDRLPGFDDGQWWVQDLSASIPVYLLGDIAGKTVYDLCAAPGGKTAQLAQKGATVTAVDVNQSRLDRVKENLDRLGLEATLIVSDVLEWTPPTLADAVLLDAPCSATGTIRRHPDILWHRTENDMNSQQVLQQALIDKALCLLKPGGILVYATCSLQPQEGEIQIKDALRRHQGLQIAPPEGSLETLQASTALEKTITKQLAFRALPSYNARLGGMDGFYAAALVKPAS